MRVRPRCLFALCVVAAASWALVPSAAAQAPAPGEPSTPGPSTPGEPGRLIVGFAPEAIANGDATDATEAVGGERVARLRSVSLDVVTVDDIDTAVEEYLEQPGVRYVEVDHRARLLSNDPFYVNQWNLQPVTASNKGTANVEPAWSRSRGRDVVVAVLDTGVRTGGTDLDASRVLAGKDFVNGDNDATDDNGHGTHVAGTIAQTTDNDRGTAGVAPDAKILPVKVLDSSGSGYYSDIIGGINWAKDQGADVINLSLGAYEASQAMCDAVANAANAGSVVVASSGNDGLGSIAYPARCDAALSVGAVRFDGTRAHYSNYGAQLDLVAPGGDMSRDQNGDGYADGILQQNYTDSWGFRFYEGTSMAAPHVSGVAALVLAVNANANVTGVLTSTTRDLGPGGRDDEFGYGALDADAAVKRAGGSGAGAGDGYWLASNSGVVRAYGSARALGSAAARGSNVPLAAIEETPSGNGYWLLDVEGGVHAFGDASYHGSVSELRVTGAAPRGVAAIDISSTPSGHGYWIMDAAGGIFTFGDARYHGGVPGLRNAGVPIGPARVIDMASTPSGRGYFVLDDVGGMFTFGDAQFLGSVPALRNGGARIGPAQIVGMAPTDGGHGYWMVDDVGGMFAFGDAGFHGSIPGLRNQGVKIGKSVIVSMEPTRDGAGYWLVDDYGGIFTFGTARYQGSFPASGVSAAAIGMAPSG